MRRTGIAGRGVRDARGFSLIELMSVMVSMGVIMAVSVAVFKHSTQAGIRLESNNNLKNFSQQSINALKEELTQSRVLYQNDTYGNALWARIQFGTTHPPMSTALLPTIQETGSLSPSEASDPTTPFSAASVGNAVFLLQLAGYVEAGDRWIDLYRPRIYYLSKTTELDISKKGWAMDLVEWEGKLYADYSQVVSSPAATYSDLVAQGITEAWNALGTSVGSTIYTVNSNGTVTTQASPTIQPRSVHSATHLFGSRGGSKYAVAFNRGPGFAINDSVPAFATASTSGDGFPHGFEVMIVGPTGGRRILARLVMVAEGYGGRYTLPITVLAEAKNY